MAIIEIVSLSLKQAGASPEALAVPFRHLKEHDIEGYNGAAYGPVVEEDGALKAFVGWDSLDAHLSFAHGEKFMPFVEAATGTYEIRGNLHVDFNRSPFAVGGPCTKGVTELFQTSFPADAVPAEAETLFEESCAALLKAKPKGFGGSVYGWVIEEQDDPQVKGRKTKSFIVLHGWDSIEDHQQAQSLSDPKLAELKSRFDEKVKAESISQIHVDCVIA